MSPRLRTCIAALFCLSLACSQMGPNQPSPPGQSISVQTSLRLPLSASSLTRMDLVVTAEDMDTLRTDLTLEGGHAIGKIEVESGSARTFTVTGYKDTVRVLHGQDTVDLEAGKEVSLHIKLAFLLPALIVSPPDTTVGQDSTVTVRISGRQMQDLITFGARLTFDPSFLRIVGLSRLDDDLTQNGGQVNQMKFSHDNAAGTMNVILGVFPAAAAVDGDIDVAQITFKALQAGVTGLSLTADPADDPDLGLYNKNADRIHAFTLGGSVTIQ